MAIIDAIVTNTPTFLRTSKPSSGSLAGSIVLNNIKLTDVPVAVGVVGGATVLAGGTTTIASWAQGNLYRGTDTAATFTQGTIPEPSKASSLLDSAGRVVMKTRPQYATYAVSQFISVKDQGAKGDGVTDDTAALKDIFAKVRECQILKEYMNWSCSSILDVKSSISTLVLMLLQIPSLSPPAHRWLGKDGRCWLGRERTSRTRKNRASSSKLEHKGQVALQKYLISCSQLLDLVGFGLWFHEFHSYLFFLQLLGLSLLNGMLEIRMEIRPVQGCGTLTSGKSFSWTKSDKIFLLYSLDWEVIRAQISIQACARSLDRVVSTIVTLPLWACISHHRLRHIWRFVIRDHSFFQGFG